MLHILMGHLLVQGKYTRTERAVIQEAASDASLTVKLVETVGEALKALDRAPPRLLFLPDAGDDSSHLATEARTHAEFRHLPVLAAERDPNDLVFVGALSFGIDDLVALRTPRELAARLRSIVKSPGPPSAPRRGTAVIAEEDRGRRVAMARVLFAAGFEVKFALTEEDVLAALDDRKVGLFSLSTNVVPDPLVIADRAAQSGTMGRIIFSVSAKDIAVVTASLSAAPYVRTLEATSPPENLVYLANEMTAPDLSNQRRSPRELYGTTVRFRAAGSDSDDVGFTYNVSAHGMYVRTLAPPIQETIWIELTPPRVGRRVRLVGEVAWRRPFGPSGHATVPPGFGLKIVDGSAEDLALWRDGLGAPLPAMSLGAAHPG